MSSYRRIYDKLNQIIEVIDLLRLIIASTNTETNNIYIYTIYVCVVLYAKSGNITKKKIDQWYSYVPSFFSVSVKYQ